MHLRKFLCCCFAVLLVATATASSARDNKEKSPVSKEASHNSVKPSSATSTKSSKANNNQQAGKKQDKTSSKPKEKTREKSADKPTAATPIKTSNSNKSSTTIPPLSDSGPEPQLIRIFKEIEANQLDAALHLTDTLVKQYPNFRLGHLIRGDLLLARTHPLTTIGNTPEAPTDKLNDLKAEAIVRLKGYQNKPSNQYIPRYLLQMPPDQRYAIVVDTKRSRLYVYENDATAGGRPRFVADYYVTQGKLGTEKSFEGDKKTPIGVYHITSSLPKEKLGDLYGSGAFPLNYPNEWDKQQGRKGSGIWLHGTMSETYSRPPRASDGCVVLTNQDLNAVSKRVQVGLTPVIISNDVEWLALDGWQKERAEFNKTIDAWRSDWESRDIDRFLSHYSKSFKAGDQDIEKFAQQKRKVNQSKEWIKVKISNLSIFRSPGKDEVIVVTFDQDYRSNNLENNMRKRQYWHKEDGKWKIVFEGAV